MIIREATENDIPDIVKVLKSSLGEDQLLLSEKVWRYKHIDNPFGKSLVLVAEEDGEIIGIRAFMRWDWQQAEQLYHCFRAVDTATHPAHQGKGIFKKLTLKAVEIAKGNGEDFIFNTPNEKSRPGYLKMGWQAVGKIKVGLKPSVHGIFGFQKKIDYNITRSGSGEDIENLCEKWNSDKMSANKLFTPKSPKFLYWRYENNPLQSYEVMSNRKFYLAAYVKKRKRLKELRIAECIYDKSSVEAQKEVDRAISKLEKKFGAQFLSFAPAFLKTGFLKIKGNYGPILTLRNLNLLEQKEKQFLQIQEWHNSLGDLELF
ncbi:hypothetical protein C7S20_17420 [Christiangramia fulva]|uniref:N-acetyltransferase domain-containing protein n=1 Tax=Christiangramia fulva TaxID=2126553 RepID=A0A2R3Z9H8_9FLAO|nr:GNAT family N-acetyltransferase [Christiangramia fulva]AVR46897.1 hypothetical protein C7S20_17420 [Christiangramia fulva]